MENRCSAGNEPGDTHCPHGRAPWVYCQECAIERTERPLGCRTEDSIVPDSERGEYLGTDKHGFMYYSRPDLYVYQYNSAGECRGWIAHITAWENSLHNLVQETI